MEISIKDINETKKEIKAKIVFEEFKKFIEQAEKEWQALILQMPDCCSFKNPLFIPFLLSPRFHPILRDSYYLYFSRHLQSLFRYIEIFL